MPLVETLTRHWRAVLIAIGAKFVETSTFFLFATFTISYLVGLGYPRVQALNVVLVAALIAVPVMLYFGALSDRIGRKKVFACGTVAIALYALPYFWLLNQGSALIATAAVVLGFPSSGPPTAPCWARSSPRAFRRTCAIPAFRSAIRWRGAGRRTDAADRHRPAGPL